MALIVAGINQQSSPVTVGEKFWLSDLQRCEALRQLTRVDGIPESVVLAMCNRAEIILRAGCTDGLRGSAR